VRRIELKGSLFDESAIGTLEVETLPQPGDVLEHAGKSYSVTDVVAEELVVDEQRAALRSEQTPNLLVIVEPLAMSQRRSSMRPPKP
jgi:hypothetical protein